MNEPNVTHLPVGEYFTFEELCYSDVATKNMMKNIPLDPQLINLTRLVTVLLDPLREKVGSLKVTSGFRSKAINEMVGGVSTSYHRRGLAADLQHKSLTPMELIDTAIELGLPFNKCIDEDNGHRQWLHIALNAIGDKPRCVVFTMRIVNGKKTYTEIKEKRRLRLV